MPGASTCSQWVQVPPLQPLDAAPEYQELGRGRRMAFQGFEGSPAGQGSHLLFTAEPGDQLMPLLAMQDGAL